jgi:Spy/CpxP family protein refolding chaperone
MMGCCHLFECKDLNLTDEQKAKIKDLQYAHHNAMIDFRAALQKARLAMRHEMMSDNPDKGKALAASKEVAAAEGKIAEVRIGHFFAMRSVLNADQLKAWKNCKAECRGMGRCGGGMKNDDDDEEFGHGMKHRDGSCRMGR